MGTREKWLLGILTGIFCVQAGILIYGVNLCSRVNPQKSVNTVCPKLGERYDNTFNTMIATTLALLTGGAVATMSKPKSKPTPPPPGRQ